MAAVVLCAAFERAMLTANKSTLGADCFLVNCLDFHGGRGVIRTISLASGSQAVFIATMTMLRRSRYGAKAKERCLHNELLLCSCLFPTLCFKCVS